MDTPSRDQDAPPVTPDGLDLLGFALELLTVPDGVEKNDPTPADGAGSEPAGVGQGGSLPMEAADSGDRDPVAEGKGKVEARSPASDVPSPSLEEGEPRVAEVRSPGAVRRRAPSRRFGQVGAFVSQSAGAQLALMAFAGIGVLAIWTFLERRALDARTSPAAERAVVETSSLRPFPKLEMQGAERVREEEVEVLLEPRKSEARPPTSSEPEPSERGVVVLRPGQLMDEETGRVLEVQGPTPRTSSPPLVRARAQGSAATPVATARFFAPGGLLTGASPPRAPADPGLALQVGDRFRVKLEVGVVSSLREDVLASVVEDVVRNGRVVLAKGDMLRGTASHDDKRIFIRFRSVESAGSSLHMAAYAVDGAMPGLVARRREATVEERTRSRAAENVIGGVAAEAGAALSGAAAVGRIAERVASGAASEAADAVELDRSWVLEVSAGRAFEVVITEAKKT